MVINHQAISKLDHLRIDPCTGIGFGKEFLSTDGNFTTPVKCNCESNLFPKLKKASPRIIEVLKRARASSSDKTTWNFILILPPEIQELILLNRQLFPQSPAILHAIEPLLWQNSPRPQNPG